MTPTTLTPSVNGCVYDASPDNVEFSPDENDFIWPIRY
jgi:hypothetical protein